MLEISKNSMISRQSLILKLICNKNDYSSKTSSVKILQVNYCDL